MKETSEPFTGHTAAMRAENRWLGAEDIYGYGDVRVTITDVIRYQNVQFEDGRTKKEVFALRFKGKKKELILSPTKRRPLVLAWGTDVRNWIGKTIALFVDTDVRKPGTRNEKTWGIRVRDIDPAHPLQSLTKHDAEAKPKPSAELTQWLVAISALASLEECDEFRPTLETCPEELREQVEEAFANADAMLTERAKSP